MAYSSSGDKAEKGTPGLLFRQRLEYGIGMRGLKQKWDLLWSMHSHQASANPEDAVGSELKPGQSTLNELIKINDKELMDCAEISDLEDVSLLTEGQRIGYIKILAQCLKRIDEINYRGALLESVRGGEGPKMPL